MPSDSPTLELARALISRPSITPKDEGCQEIIINRLQNIGFDVTRLDYGDVKNFWAIRGNSGPIFCFAGHTDVVPIGDESSWEFNPFKPTVHKGLLYGRGAADMKGSLAAMVVATERYFSSSTIHKFRIAFLITSDEEGEAINGTRRVVEWLQKRELLPKWCVVGEPSSAKNLADTIKNGRRGSLGCVLTIHGIQGHVAYPHLANNPIHQAMPALQHLIDEKWDEGNKDFPPTTLQISNIMAGSGAVNVIPGKLIVRFNFRFSTELSEQILKDRTSRIMNEHGLNHELDWQLTGKPFLTKWGPLVETASDSISNVVGYRPQLSTEGGTSDARFIAPMGTEVIELGPVNKTIHKVNEHVRVTDLEKLTDIYQDLLARLII